MRRLNPKEKSKNSRKRLESQRSQLKSSETAVSQPTDRKFENKNFTSGMEYNLDKRLALSKSMIRRHEPGILGLTNEQQKRL